MPRGYASSVIIAKNSCSLISPSWSRSNSSIIACLEEGEPRISITVLDKCSRTSSAQGDSRQNGGARGRTSCTRMGKTKMDDKGGVEFGMRSLGSGMERRASDVGWALSTHSSSSSRRSPISFATRRRFLRLILPVLSSSNSWNARRISSIGSRARMRSVTGCAETAVGRRGITSQRAK